jgi:hypothetical protein
MELLSIVQRIAAILYRSRIPICTHLYLSCTYYEEGNVDNINRNIHVIVKLRQY